MSESWRYATNLYTEINEALKPIYLTEKEHDELSLAVEQFEGETDLNDVLERLEKIVIIQQDDTDD
tara:strand:+ start:228 stop:425 length:198 start_codon:yes stop_codon:yes gene_type:complete